MGYREFYVNCTVYNERKILVKYSTHKHPTLVLNTPNWSSGVVFLTASGFLGKRPQTGGGGYLVFNKGIYTICFALYTTTLDYTTSKNMAYITV